MRTAEELGEELCNHCPLEKQQKGVHCYGGEPVFCVDSGCCEGAYEAYKEDGKNCIGCGEFVHAEDSQYIQKAADDEYGPLCKKCYEEAE